MSYCGSSVLRVIDGGLGCVLCPGTQTAHSVWIFITGLHVSLLPTPPHVSHFLCFFFLLQPLPKKACLLSISDYTSFY